MYFLNIRFKVCASFLLTTNFLSIQSYVIADLARDTLIREWKKLLSEENRQLKVLSKNGIEYFYPERILQEIFKTNEAKEEIVTGYLGANPNKYNNIELTKVQLAQKVSESLNIDDLYDAENELFSFLKTLQ